MTRHYIRVVSDRTDHADAGPATSDARHDAGKLHPPPAQNGIDPKQYADGVRYTRGKYAAQIEALVRASDAERQPPRKTTGGRPCRAVISNKGEVFASMGDAALRFMGSRYNVSQVSQAVKHHRRFAGRRWKYLDDPRGWDEIPGPRGYNHARP